MGAVVPVRLVGCPRCAGADSACAEGEDIEDDDIESEVGTEDIDGGVCKQKPMVEAKPMHLQEEQSTRSSSKSSSSCGARSQTGKRRERPLRDHFLSRAYTSGYDMDTAGTGYVLEPPLPQQGRMYSLYRHASTGVVVASQAIHLVPFGSPDLEVVYHYGSDRALHEICSAMKVSARQWESLRLDGLLCGKFIYAVGLEPKQVAGLDSLGEEWPEQAKCCLPLVLPRAWLVRGGGLRLKACLLRDLQQLPALDVCMVRCPAQSRALSCAASCGLQRQRSLVGRQRREKGIEDPNTLSALSQLAWVLERQGDSGEAEKCYREVLKGCERHFGASHPMTLKALSQVAHLLQAQSQHENAEPFFRRLSERCEVLLGPSHTDTLSACNQLATILAAQGKLHEAEPLLRQTLARCEQALGPEHARTLQSVGGLADLLEAEGRLEEAEALQRRVSAWSEHNLGEFHQDSIRALSRLARLVKARGELGEAECHFRRALVLTREQRGDWHLSTLMREDSLAAVFVSQGKLGMAASAYRSLLEGKEASLGSEHAETLATVGTLAELLEAQGEWEQAEALYRRVHDGHASKLGLDHPKSLTSAKRLATLVTKTKCKSKGGKLAGRAKMKPKVVGVSGDRLPGPPILRLLESHLTGLGAEPSETIRIANEIACLLGVARRLSFSDSPWNEGAEGPDFSELVSCGFADPEVVYV